MWHGKRTRLISPSVWVRGWKNNNKLLLSDIHDYWQLMFCQPLLNIESSSRCSEDWSLTLWIHQVCVQLRMSWTLTMTFPNMFRAPDRNQPSHCILLLLIIFGRKMLSTSLLRTHCQNRVIVIMGKLLGHEQLL